MMTSEGLFALLGCRSISGQDEWRCGSEKEKWKTTGENKTLTENVNKYNNKERKTFPEIRHNKFDTLQNTQGFGLQVSHQRTNYVSLWEDISTALCIFCCL